MRRRGSMMIVAAAVTALGLTGCNAGVNQRTLEVYFTGGTTPAQLAAATEACTGVAANTSPMAPTKQQTDDPGLAGNSDEIRFAVNKASDQQIAELTTCLNNQPRVYGVNLSSPEDD